MRGWQQELTFLEIGIQARTKGIRKTMLKLALIAHLLTLTAGGQLLEKRLQRTLQDEKMVRMVVGFKYEQSYAEFEAHSKTATTQFRHRIKCATNEQTRSPWTF
jgi:hypothetical protein